MCVPKRRALAGNENESSKERLMAMVETQDTPFMRQYKALKRDAPAGSILLVQIGDFYEAFGEDAVRLAPIFGTTLTKRSGIPMTGCPRHSLDMRLSSPRAKDAVFAVADIAESPLHKTGLLRREIVRVINAA